MSFAWLSWSNPVAVWWGFLLAVSAINIALLFGLRACYRANPFGAPNCTFAFEPLALLSAAYVLGCVFRSILPRADVQRICLFDTWLSSVLIGRSVATVAELCFAVQWAILLRELGRITHSETARNISRLVVPLIAVAELCSWYAVVSTNFLGNVLENSLWTIAFALVGIALVRLALSFRGIAQFTLAALAAGTAGYVIFMCSADVPMYFVRWQAQRADGTHYLGLLAGLHDIATYWVVTHSYARWHNEIPWMSLYFSVAVWTSLLVGGFGLVRHRVPRYRVGRPLLKATRQPVPVAIRSS
ncbi:MAG: hypothetical protein WBD71_20160 [Xanthobacteraceae bacterium]